MADTKLSALTAAASVGDTDEMYVNAGGVSKKVTGANLRASVYSAGSIATATIADSAVTLAKIVNASAQYKLMARTSASAGVWQELTSSANMFSLLGCADYSAARTALSLVPGTDVQAYDAELAAIAGLTSAANALPYFTGSGTAAVTTLSAAGRALIDDADATAQRTTLGLAIGTNVQAWDADLDALAGLTSAADSAPYFTGSAAAALMTVTAAARTVLDDTTTSAMRTTLGLAIGTDVCQQRTITGGTGITVSNGSGAGGNPTISLTQKRQVAQLKARPPQTLGAQYAIVSGASSPVESFGVWDFDPTTVEYLDLYGVMGSVLPASAGVTLAFLAISTDATHNFIFTGSMRKLTGVDLDTTAFTFTTAEQGSGTVAVSGTTGTPVLCTIAFTTGTNMNSVAAGDRFMIRLRRKADDGSDTVDSNDMRVLADSFILEET